MYTVTISSKGQVVLPQPVRQALGLQEGDKLTVTIEEHSVKLTPMPTQQETGWRRWRGYLAGTQALQDHLAEHAEEVDNERLS
jgi:AbrB family looped-hinge helix DNA binding protein